MELRHLNLVKAVAEQGTLTRAAERLALSQSALSHQLKEIESTCGGQVFNRVNKKMVLTTLGNRVLQMATAVLHELDSGLADIKHIAAGENTSIRISTQCYTFYHWLSDVLRQYQSVYPKSEVQVVTDATYRVLGWLERGKLDLAIVNYKPDPKVFNIQELFEDELLVLLSPEHTLARKDYIRPQDLTDIHYITYALPKGQYGKTYEQVFAANKIEPRRIVQVELTEAIIEMVKANLGISILAKWAVEPHLEQDGIKVLPLTKDGTRRRWYAATLPFRETPQHFVAFIEILKGLGRKAGGDRGFLSP